MLKITICPTCGSEKIRLVRRDWKGVSDDKSFVVPKLAFYECPQCGERVYDPEAMLRIEGRLRLPKTSSRL